MQDPEYAEAASVLERVQRYGKYIMDFPFTSPSSFFHTDLLEDWQSTDIALIGIPSDAGLTCRPGARYGPQAIRAQSCLVGYSNPVTKVIPYECACIRDGGDVPLVNRLHLEALIEELGEFYQNVQRSRTRPVSVGGDHSVTYPIIKSLTSSQPVGLIHIDAHHDTYIPLHGTRYHHGTPFYHCLKEGLIDPQRSVQLAMRDPYWEFTSLSARSGMTVIPMHQFQEMSIARVLEQVRQIVGTGPAYLSFDIDALDPAFAPGTGTPVAGGLTSREAMQLLQGLRGLNIVGGDLVEVSPPYDPTGVTALTGAYILFEILCLVAEAHAHYKA